MNLYRAAFVATAVAASVMATSVQDQKTAIAVAYSKMTKAMVSKDMKAYFGYMTPDYKEKRIDRLVDLGFVREDMTRYINMLHDIVVKRQVISVKPSGTAALAETNFKLSGNLKGSANRKIKMDTIQTTRDTWIKTAKGWQIKNSTVLKNLVLVNGKPLTGGGFR